MVQDSSNNGKRSSEGALAKKQSFRRSTSSICSYSTIQDTRNLLPEVLEFETFEASAGSEGGWHPDDHAEFMRMYQAAKGDMIALEATAVARLFHLDSDDIQSHIRWYLKREELLRGKREAIKAWKAQKCNEKKALQQDSIGEELSAATSKQQSQQREETKRRVKQWRKEKAEEDRVKADRQAAMQEMDAAAEAAVWKAQQEAKQKAALAYKDLKMKQQRDAEEERANQEREAKEAARPTPEQIASSQKRTADHLQRRTSLLSSKARAKAEEQARLELLRQQAAAKVGVSAVPDFDRLTGPTLSLFHRDTAEEPPPIRYAGMSIRTISRRAQPSWRKGL